MTKTITWEEQITHHEKDETKINQMQIVKPNQMTSNKESQ